MNDPKLLSRTLMLVAECPDYRVCWSRSDFEGTDVLEIFPGDFSGEISWWNAGAAYVREDGFEPFLEILLAIAPRFDWHGETRLGRRACLRLTRRLAVLAGDVERARTAEALHAAFGNRRVYVDATDVLVRRAQLLKMIADLQLLAQTAIDKRTGLWLLGL